ncbi:MAG: endonuclease, partial [Lentimicrobiaceae bacterium]
IKNGPDYSFIGFDPTVEPTELIDFILATWNFEVISSTIIDFRTGDRYLSDHLPIITELQLNKN